MEDKNIFKVLEPLAAYKFLFKFILPKGIGNFTIYDTSKKKDIRCLAAYAMSVFHEIISEYKYVFTAIDSYISTYLLTDMYISDDKLINKAIIEGEEIIKQSAEKSITDYKNLLKIKAFREN